MRTRNLLLLLSMLPALNSIAQKDQLWYDADENVLAGKNLQRQIIPDRYRTLKLDLQALKKILSNAPMRFSEGEKSESPQVSIPMPTGGFENFSVVEAPIMHSELAAKYPYIRSYAGWSEADPTAYLRCGVTQHGFHAILFSSRHSTVFIDAYTKGDAEHYVCYFKKDYSAKTGFECLVAEHKRDDLAHAPANGWKAGGDCQLRTYALALACTGEYAQFHGGTKPNVMAQFNVAMTRVNGIYEREFAVTMELVPNTDALIFLTAATDPYTNNDGGTMLGQNQTTCDNIIGNANYDIGHVFSTGGGGVAYLTAVCQPSFKAGGVTGLSSPVGDPFYVDYVSHEMGHQYGGNHTQNNSCNRNGATAMEPGSASTIMGYAGICAPNVQSNSDDYFHAVSLDEIYTYITGGANGCASITPSGNQQPFVAVPASSYTVPVSTPIALSAEGGDPDGDPLTYGWDQMDNQVATMPPLPTNAEGPAFRSILPAESPTRYLPNLEAIINGTTPAWEVLPSVTRTMHWRCVVRDNAPGAGCTDEADMTLFFTASAGPFVVTNPNAGGVVWQVGGSAEVSWQVANTNAAPVNATAVDIYLSLDGGYTYPVLLLANTPNDGQATVSVPNNLTNEARVMVKGRNNVFFDISNEDFSIELPPTPTFLMAATPASVATCPQGEVQFQIDFISVLGFSEGLSLQVEGLPQGASAVFSPPLIVPPGSATLDISELENALPGTYPLTIKAIGISVWKETTIELTLLPALPGSPTLAQPTNGATGVTFGNTLLVWGDLWGASGYLVAVDTSPTFDNPLVYQSDSNAVAVATDPLTVYYWRVKAMNNCGESEWSSVFAFQTGVVDCRLYEGADVPVTIPDDSEAEVSSTIEIFEEGLLAYLQLSLNISHTWIGDLDAMLYSPSANTTLLFDRPGVPASEFGCANDDIIAKFFDDAPQTAETLENTCAVAAPTIQGEFQPIGTFLNQYGQNQQGTWTLKLADHFPEDGGSLNAWSLTLCTSVSVAAAIEEVNNPLTLLEFSEEHITEGYLKYASPMPPIPDTVHYILLSVPKFGLLMKGADTLGIGDRFTQADISNLAVSYRHTDPNGLMDGITFDVLTAAGNWLHDQSFDIIVLQNTLAGTAAQTHPVTCHNSSDAQITLSVSGGTPPLTFYLNSTSAQPDPVFNGLPAGTYIPSVSDSNGLVLVLDTMVIENPDMLLLSTLVTTDTIAALVSDGVPPYQYNLNGGTYQSSPLFIDLPNGVYAVGVIDANGCEKSATAIVAVNTMVASAEIVQTISCYQASDGAIAAFVNGGQPPYQYSLSGGPFLTSNHFEGLSSGSYIITAMDSQGFTIDAQPVELSDPPQLSLSASVSGYEVTAMATGGTGLLLYSLDGGAPQSNSTFFPVSPGLHTIIVTDANGCTAQIDAEVIVAPLGVLLANKEDASCFGSADGSLSIEGTGGVGPYQYSLNGGPFQNEGTFSGLAAGNYVVTVMDTGGFTHASAPVSIDAPAPIEATIQVNELTLEVMASGGTAPYEYSLNGGTFQTAVIFEITQNGPQLITVRDANGCTGQFNEVVNIPPPLINNAVTSSVSCSGGEDGAIVVNADCTAAPCLFSLDGQFWQASNIFEDIPEGTYTVYVRDVLSSVSSLGNVVVSAPSALQVSADVFGPQVTVVATGGTPPYLYSLDGQNFQDDPVFGGLANDDYTVQVVDAHGCSITTTVTVNAPVEVQLDIVPASCFGESNGQIIIMGVVGGYPPYLFSLNGGDFTSQVLYDGLPAGTYNLTVQDATGYQFTTQELFIEEPQLFELAFDSEEDTLIILVPGGVGEFMYSIDGGMSFQTSPVFPGVPNGTYQVVVKDEKGCLVSAEVIMMTNAAKDELRRLNFHLWPNPGSGLFHVELPLMKAGYPEASIQVFDVTGRLVHLDFWSLSGSTGGVLVLEDLPSGSYHLRIASGYLWGAATLILIR